MNVIRSFRKAIDLHLGDALLTARRFPKFWSDYRQFVRALPQNSSHWPILPNYPCLLDLGDSGGVASGHYFHQDLHVARRIFQLSPAHHVDVGSRVDGFVAHVAAFREIEVLDIRPIRAVENSPIRFRQADLMRLNSDLVECADSVSCLHALEHFGLGRYGDHIDVNGYISGFTNLITMVKPGGRLHLSVPIGSQRIEFNAHRIFDPRTILGLASQSTKCVMFSFVDDSGDLHADVGISDEIIRQAQQLSHGCGIFEFVKN